MKKKNRFSNFIWAIIAISIFGYTIYGFGFRILNNSLVDENAIHTKAVIINEENVFPNLGGINPELSYSYEFEVEGKKYRGDSHDKRKQIGDTVEIKYYKRWPSFNKPIHPKD